MVCCAWFGFKKTLKGVFMESVAEKKVWIDKVDALVKEKGMVISNACRQLGIEPKRYYTCKHSIKMQAEAGSRLSGPKKKKKPEMLTFAVKEEPKEQDVVRGLIDTVSLLTELIKKMAVAHGK